MLDSLHSLKQAKVDSLIPTLKSAAVQNENIFEQLMELSKVASLGQITDALFEVGGQYRRNM